MAMFVLVGTTTSVLSAWGWHSRQEAQARAAFANRASDLAITVGSGLDRDTDFMASQQARIETSLHLDNARFALSIKAVGAAQRYPGGIGYSYYEYVPAAGLKAFESAFLADPPVGVATAGYHVASLAAGAGDCLLRFQTLTAPLPAGFAYPADLSVCPAGSALAVSHAVASAQFVVPLVIDPQVVIAAPVYAGGLTPATRAGRRAAFAGWILGNFNAARLVGPAATVSGVRTEILFQNAGAKPTLVASSGPVPHGQVTGRTLDVQADGHWTVDVEGVVAGTSWWGQAVGLLAIGLLLTALLFGFVQVLAHSRRRALRLVAERTRELHHQALHDNLTGLPNRALILDRAEQMLARGRRDLTPVAALFMDLDGFKDVNDTYGHAAGDRLLQAVAGRITGTLRERDTAGRLGGDEFVVLVDGQGTNPEIVAQRLLSVLREPFLLDGATPLRLTAQASIGIAAGDRDHAGDLLRDADIALYQAKDAGGDRYATFSAGMQTDARDRVEIGVELNGALEAGEFFLAYQPTFSLRDMTVTGVEALIRWRHPGRGVIAPVDFIPIAENSGLIIPMGAWVLRTACAEAAGWQGPDRRLSLAVNLSARQLDSDDLIGHIRSALADSGLPPDLLTLEITETALMRDPDAAATRIASLKAIGVRIAIDDFGTGYASLTYLRRFHVDAIKIDRSFVASMADSIESAVIVRMLVQLGKTLGIETVAEGIEAHQQLRHLQREDCDSGQGFLFARPLSPDALQGLIGPAGKYALPMTISEPR
jgi:diguanylate cyclase (GGDEF)-like protein